MDQDSPLLLDAWSSNGERDWPREDEEVPIPNPELMEARLGACALQLPNPSRLLGERAERLRVLAPGHQRESCLRFLTDLTDAQLRVLPELSEPDMPPADVVALAKEHAIPPLDGNGFKPDPAFDAMLERLLSLAATLQMPAQARDALDRSRATDAQAREAMIRNVLADSIPIENLAEHVFVAAALQVHFSRLADRVDKDALVSVGDGACPYCGVPPVASVVVGWPGAVGSLFCSCSLCGTLWNHVRACWAICGSTDKISFHEIEGSGRSIKAENWDVCHSYVKVLYQQTDPSLDPVADDVASLGPGLLLRESGYRRGAVNPLLIGY